MSGICHISGRLSPWTGFSRPQVLRSSQAKERMSKVRSTRTFASLTWFFSRGPKPERPSISSTERRGRGPGLTSRSGLKVPQGVPAHTTSEWPSLTSFSKGVHWASSSALHGWSATKSMQQTIKPKCANQLGRSPFRRRPLKRTSAQGRSSKVSEGISSQVPYSRGPRARGR